MTSIFIAVTGGSIAHALRPLPIALRLRQRGAHVVFGGRGPYVKFLVEQGFPVVPLPMLDYARVCKMMDSERFHFYSMSEYRSAVSAQRGYLEALQPDLVLQDGPDTSLPIAALEAGIKHIDLTNATVLGYAGPQRVVPFRPWLRDKVKWSGAWTRWANSVLILQRNLRINLPIFMYLAHRGISVKQIPQSALIPDLPELFNAPTDVAGKVFIGPLLYEPEVPLPSWWKMLDNSRPLVYVGVGSSGGATGLRTIIAALAESEYQVVLSTADAFEAGDLPSNFFAARLIPRAAILRRALAMVYHGGSATTYQAIRHGVPMIAIPAHIDHDLNAQAVVAQGLGLSIFPHELTADGLRKAVDELVDSPQVARNLKRFQLILAKRRDPAEEGADLLLEYATRDNAARLHTGWFPTSPVVLEEVACDLCGDTQNQPEKKIEDVMLPGNQVYNIVRCKKCDLVYCSPRPNQISHWLLEPLEHGGNSPANITKTRHGIELRTIRRLAKIDLQSRVLVAGCGAGHFAQYLLERVGCETVCVEEHPALLRRARARGLWVKKGSFDDLPDKESGFDVILFLETLERSFSPKSALTSARERLSPAGRLVIKTADGAKQDAAIDVPHALYLFTAKTLDALLRQTGFTEIRNLNSRSNHVWCTAIREIR
jgi:UDP:flavonoid glycosyltransferase YjiC (YdhE family)